MSDANFGPKAGSLLFGSLKDKDTIILAANLRIGLVNRGIFRAAKDMDAALIVELARSESDLDGGYTGQTPADFARMANEAAQDVEFEIWTLHADHIGIKKGTPGDIKGTKELVSAQINAGFTSFAIDASHLFNFQGGDLREELADNINATIEVAKHIEERMAGRAYGLEVEVGEIGREDASGRVLTRPEEAVTFITALNENGIKPHVLAIANGSAHGNTYDALGNLIEQVSIDIPQTRAVARALRDNNLNVRIAQHGITGTPRDLIHNHFPRGDIIKGNVATFYQNMVWDLFKVYEPELYSDIWNWTLDTYREQAKSKSDDELFGKFSKFAIKQFYDRIYSVGEDTKMAIDAMAYAETLVFLKAFNAGGSAQIVRDSMM